MKWTLSQLQKYRDKDFIIDEIVSVDEIKEVDQTIREVSPMHITGQATIDSRRVTFSLHIKGHLVLPCSRTLVDVNYPIDVKTTEIFLISDVNYDVDEEVHEVKGDVIDLRSVLQEILLLEVPIQVFCEDQSSDEGAPQSGKDWKVIHEQTKMDEIDPRLAGLAKLLDQDHTRNT